MATPQLKHFTVTTSLPNSKPVLVDADKYELKEGFFEFSAAGKFVAAVAQPHVVSIESVEPKSFLLEPSASEAIL